MERWYVILGVAFALLFASSALLSVRAQATGAEPYWVSVTSTATGNFPGGNEEFLVFIVDSSGLSGAMLSVDNITLSAPFMTNHAIGLPTVLTQGEAVLLPIYLQVPSGFTGTSFTAQLVGSLRFYNGSSWTSLTASGSALVDVIAPPGPPASATGAGSVSQSLFAVGVSLPSAVAIVLLAILVRRRSPPRTQAQPGG